MLSASFHRLATSAARAAASPWAFAIAVASVLGWAAAGPFFGWSDGHQLVINTGTTIVTLLMVFLLQHAQARDTAAMQAKLDEVVRGVPGARNEVIGIEREGAVDVDVSDLDATDATETAPMRRLTPWVCPACRRPKGNAEEREPTTGP